MGRISAAEPDDNSLIYRTARDLLQARQYTQLAEALQRARVVSEHRDDQTAAQVLVMARRLCLACTQCRIERQWYRQAHVDADRQEQALRHRLRRVLDLLEEIEVPHTDQAVSADPSVDLEQPEGDILTPPARPRLWQRIRTFLRHALHPGGTQPQEPKPSIDPSHSDEPQNIATSNTEADSAEKTKPIARFLATAEQIDWAESERGLTVPTDPAAMKQEMPGQVAAEEVEGPDAGPIQETEAPDGPVTLREQLSVPPIGEKAEISKAEVSTTPPSEDVETPRASAVVGEAAPVAFLLVVYCLGPFRVYQDEQPIVDWPSSKGKCIFKYLVTHRERPVAKEVLMELFWPGAHPDAARNSLNVAIYGLREALRQARPAFSHVLFQDDCYLFNPDLEIWVDVEEFMEHVRVAQDLERRGELAAAIHNYRAAEALYQGEFLEEDRYEEWLIPERQRLQDDYLSLLDRLSRHYFAKEDYAACATLCSKMLAVETCCEDAHRRLMRCYSRQGQRYLALRQYHLCVETLDRELAVAPAVTTVRLYDRLRRREHV